ncbi:hypothetical protein EIP86_004630 [Pleurotus ostreatoroseus]|nr:hypothetical protein EIP86_004630 [Pleurotus ostreatoroseus]
MGKRSKASERGWRTAFEIGEAYTREQTDRWKDELSNLLIVAGLFSAVVTSFLVQSLSSLQQNPADVTNQLLTQISAQLGSFSVTPGYINTTTPAAQTTAAFVPTRNAVNVNGLWAVSLLLSLLTAFVAIAAQPSVHPPPRANTLNTRITVICAVVFGLFFYQFVKIECLALASDGKVPWKSAFLPASFTAILWSLWMLLEFPLIVILFGSQTIAEKTQWKGLIDYHRRLESLASYLGHFLWRSKYLGPLFRTAEAVSSASYWRVAEGRTLAKLDAKSRSRWDASALALALSNVTHYSQLRDLKGCFSDLTMSMKIRSILIAMWQCSEGLQLLPTGPGFAIYPGVDKIQPLNAQTLAQLVRTECAPYFALLEQCVRVNWKRHPLLIHPDAERSTALYVSSALAILYQSGHYLKHDLAHLLVYICSTMVEYSITASSRVPYILLYKICADAHPLNKREPSINNIKCDKLWVRVFSVEVFMTTTCTALRTAVRLAHRKRGSLYAILRNLLTLLEHNAKEVNEVLDIIFRQLPLDRTYLVTPEALADICDALVLLAERRDLPLRLGAHCPSLQLKEKLDALCDGRPEAVFPVCRDRLRQFGELCIRNSEERLNASDVHEDQTLEDELTSLVVAEGMLADGIEGGFTEV